MGHAGDVSSADHAINTARERLPAMMAQRSHDPSGVGIIESDVPMPLFESLPHEIPYRGFFPYNLNSTQIRLTEPIHRLIFNNHIVR
jgi:hypothetical protein